MAVLDRSVNAERLTIPVRNFFEWSFNCHMGLRSCGMTGKSTAVVRAKVPAAASGYLSCGLPCLPG